MTDTPSSPPRNLPPSPARVAAYAVPAVVGIAGLAAWPLAAGRLPDSVATHWSLSGDADGSMARGTAFAFPAVAIVVSALITAAAVRTQARITGDPDAAPMTLVWAGVGGFLAGLFGSLSLLTVLANLDATDWHDAELPLLTVVPALAVAVACGALVAWATVPRPVATGSAAAAAAAPPAPGPAPTSRVAWAGAAHARWAWITAAVCGVAAAATLPFVPVTAIVLAVPAAAFAWIASLRVTVGAHGVRVRSGLSPWPSVHLPLDAIASAEAIDLRPRSWGGWGYRGSLRVFRRAAWVLRAGPGLRVDLKDGRTFAVTVEHPDEAAAVLDALLAPAPTSDATDVSA